MQARACTMPDHGNRLTLNAQDLSRREYLVTKFQLLPSSENIFLVTKDGWHPAEVDAKNPANEWQWTKKTATLSFRNPKKDSAFYLDYDARPDLFNPPQHVTVKIGDKVITDFAADVKERTLRIFPISADQLGAADMVDLVFDVDKTFAPGAGDPRELGIRVYHTYLGSK